MSYKIKKSNKSSSKGNFPKFALIAAVVLILAASGYAGYNYYHNNNSEIAQTTEDSGYVNMDPATEEDKAEADKNKERLSQKPSEERPEESEETPSGQKKQVDPEITVASLRSGYVDVRSYVGGIYESTGKCTATFTSGSKTITRVVEGIKDATTTRCDRVLVEENEFAGSSNWKVVISYSSPTAEGSSPSREVSGL